MNGLRIPKQLPPWREVVATAERESWYPLCFDRSQPDHVVAMDELMGSGEVINVHDTINAQLADLIKCRNPSSNLSAEELAGRTTTHLAGASVHDYGCWVYFPWSRRLVHLLPPAEFSEVRSDRNRNKITKAEQAKLGRLKVALAGLSVGNAIANTLALEGVFGELRMADFDTLDLSNMNRIRCAVHHIGLNKAIIGARQIFEQNPYANLVLFTDGVTAENLGEFLDGADLCLDECDSMYIKVKLREEARARRMPVVMETSDRGMLDVERFDLEPDRPILHGLLGGLTAADVPKMSPPERMDLMLRILGVTTISARIAASLLEFGRSLRGVSQLGSDVVLGGASTTIVVRRFGLGLPLNSGRTYLDISEHLAEIHAPTSRGDDLAAAGRHRELVLMRKLVEAAVLAPSHGNRQPWRFNYRDRTLSVNHDPERSGGVGDEYGRQTACIAIGAAIENIAIVAATHGHDLEVDLFPVPRDATRIADLKLTPRAHGPHVDPLSEQIGQRMTNRRLSAARTPLTPIHAQVLSTAAREGGARLQICSEKQALDTLAGILGEARRLEMLSPVMHADLMQSLRWTTAEMEQSRDGISLESYAVNLSEAASLQLIRSYQVAKLLRDVNGGASLSDGTSQAIAASAGVGLLTVQGTDARAFVAGGRAMQQVWLTATALGLSVHPMNGLVGLLARVERYGGAGLDKHEIRAAVELRDQLTRCFTVSLSHAEIILFRLSYALPAAQRSLRRDINDVFTAD
jgi:molybdopterin/thiamine biosynthesis adenylyltransferase/nitroreductase